MPIEDPDDKAVSSTVTDDTAASSAAQQDEGAASSPAEEGAKKPGSILDAVNSVLEAEDQGGASPSAGSGKEPGSQTEAKADGENAPKELTPEEEAKLPFHQHPRWREMKDERNRLRQTVDSLNKELPQLRQSHQTLQGLHTFISDAGLNTEEVNSGFEIMRLMKHDPAKALEALTPYVAALQELNGHVLPADLKDRVEKGELSEADARTISQARSREGLARQAADKATARANEIQQATQRETLVQDIGKAVSDWETKWKGADPDYKLKHQRVTDAIELHVMKNGYPKTSQAAVKMCNDIKTKVEEELRGILPQKREIKPGPTGGASGKVVPQPKSMLDVIDNALATGS
jgi:hypothetical protein